MKKLLIATLSLLALAASGQTFTSQSFLGVQAVSVTNGVAVTNLNGFGVTTNLFGTYYTNNNTFANSTNLAQQQVNLLKSASLWADREGTPITLRNYAATNDQTTVQSYVTSLNVRLVGEAFADTAVSFVLTPLLGSSQRPSTSDKLTVSVLPNGSTVVNTNIPLPLWNWPGVNALALERIVNGDTGATSRVWVVECNLNGYIP